MKDSTKNLLFRTFLLLLNAAMIGAIVLSAKDKKKVIAASDNIKSEAVMKAAIDRSVMEKGINIVTPTDQVATATANSDAENSTLPDGSRLSVMEDGFGGTTATRSFGGDKLLRMVVIQTAADGTQRIFVYGRNGAVNSVPDTIAKKIITASPAEIASSAKIYTSVSETESRNIRQREQVASVRRDAEEARQREIASRPAPVQTVERAPVEEAATDNNQ